MTEVLWKEFARTFVVIPIQINMSSGKKQVKNGRGYMVVMDVVFQQLGNKYNLTVTRRIKMEIFYTIILALGIYGVCANSVLLVRGQTLAWSMAGLFFSSTALALSLVYFMSL